MESMSAEIELDEIEVQIVAGCIARGISYAVPLMRYQIARDREREKHALERRYAVQRAQ
jgi:hypothetical protein